MHEINISQFSTMLGLQYIQVMRFIDYGQITPHSCIERDGKKLLRMPDALRDVAENVDHTRPAAVKRIKKTGIDPRELLKEYFKKHPAARYTPPANSPNMPPLQLEKPTMDMTLTEIKKHHAITKALFELHRYEVETGLYVPADEVKTEIFTGISDLRQKLEVVIDRIIGEVRSAKTKQIAVNIYREKVREFFQEAETFFADNGRSFNATETDYENV